MNSEITTMFNGYLARLNEGLLGTSLQELTLLQILIILGAGILIWSFMD